ncbi:DUF3566 domain-containing protein [Amycolatopsis benzoatilytica]|uniref:DUF3566 domain-containing protein n=1 Tax=Amycolatopsis benzoatilytica TaxID=346045 RepID=UPI00035C69CA|nr:DUF3566 domain-containing protein [Amycolatopsis benzoatilytica]
MAPSEKADDTSANPPWQRTAKDGGSESEATARIATEDVPPAAASPVHPAENDYPVTGTAAPRLFGAEAPPSASAEVPPAARTRPTPSALRRPGRGPRRASLQIKRFDPWSVLKLALVLGVAMFFVWLVAVGVLYTVLDGMGVWDKLNGTYSSLVGGEGANASAEPLISAGRVFGIAAILGAVNIVLVSALATVSAFIYNVSADLAGGLEVTLSERE